MKAKDDDDGHSGTYALVCLFWGRGKDSLLATGVSRGIAIPLSKCGISKLCSKCWNNKL